MLISDLGYFVALNWRLVIFLGDCWLSLTLIMTSKTDIQTPLQFSPSHVTIRYLTDMIKKAPYLHLHTLALYLFTSYSTNTILPNS
ncbi:hypothetical protein HanIR_Chr17g0893231 [Helianthus annuus]|nr:hypothetical protein HanIR_Chr17g0893231 [Helianthus annuus]